ncbi:MAG: NADH-quinone oxidoreductase subunit N [Flammeovirgaceae bacterium]
MQLNLYNKLQDVINSLPLFTSEIVLVVAIFLIILTDLIFVSKSKWLSLLTFICILLNVFLLTQQEGENILFLGMLEANSKALFFKILANFSALFVIIFRWVNKEFELSNTINNKILTGEGEQMTILIAIILGIQLMVSSTNLLMIFLSVEMVSICAYIFTIFRFRAISAEAGMKYLLFGALSSAVMLYGMSWLYGFSGSLYLSEIAKNISNNQTPLLFVSFLMVFGGLLFKVASFPFHLWIPDIYQAAPTSWIAFLSIAPKAAAFGVMTNLTVCFSDYYNINQTPFYATLVFLAVASMLIGNLSALWQSSFKRLLAYSSIAHTGFILLAIPTIQQSGFQSLKFYLLTYTFMNFGAFFLADTLEKQKGSDQIKEFQGTGMHTTLLGILTVILMISLAGLPPTAGFTAKLLVFSSLWNTIQQTQQSVLLIAFFIGILNAIVSLFYYLKIPFLMFFRKSEDDLEINFNYNQIILLIIFIIPLIVLFFKPLFF